MAALELIGPGMRRTVVLLCTALPVFGPACSGRDAASEEGLVHLTGAIQVIAAGTLSETIVLETPGGAYYVLTGDVPAELREGWGVVVSVTGRPVSLEGWPVRPELPRIWVVDCVIEGEPASGDLPGD
ncbi:hypothetical protein GX411_11560 [Candidatus Fermentibacteria bacterium]|nr:hypothetical protein [Candidatus Fermentibacteria bacterium]